MSIGFKGVYCFIWKLNCLKIEACSENTQSVSGVGVGISSWISRPLQHAERPKSKNHGNRYRTPEKGFYPSTVLLSLLPFVELSC